MSTSFAALSRRISLAELVKPDEKTHCIGGHAFLTSSMTEQPGYIQHMVNQHKPHQDQVSPQSYEGDPNAQGHLHGRQMVRFAFLLRKII